MIGCEMILMKYHYDKINEARQYKSRYHCVTQGANRYYANIRALFKFVRTDIMHISVAYLNGLSILYGISY